MGNIKVMTWNVQLLPRIAPPPIGGVGHESYERALKVVEIIKNMPPSDLPDVLALNEVFDEPSRLIILLHLQSIYPHIVKKLSTWISLEDSGLMLFSKHPFLKLPEIDDVSLEDDEVLFYSFPNDPAEFDGPTFAEAHSSKGVGVVIIECPLGRITIGFTHLHAFYDNEDDRSRIRGEQLKSIEDKILLKLSGPPSINNTSWEKVILMGDLNIRGNIDGTGRRAAEWYGLFEGSSSSVYSENFSDGWQFFMHPPGKKQADPGLSNYNLEAGANLANGIEMRLDYQLFGYRHKSIALNEGRHIVPQHMRLLHFPTSRSDHKALVADVNLYSDHCTPSLAIRQNTFRQYQEIFYTTPLTFVYTGSYQWVYIEDPGTYTFLPPVGFDLLVYEEDNITSPLANYDTEDINNLGLAEITQDLITKEFKLVSRVEQFRIRKPSLLLIKSSASNNDFTGTVFFGYIKHTGANRNLAIVLDPWAAPENPLLPTGKKNGDRDECWFRIGIGTALSNEPHQSTFYLDSQAGDKVTIQLFESKTAIQPIAAVTNKNSELVLHYTTTGPQDIYVVLKRLSFFAVHFLAGWQSAITYLANTPLRVFCKEETSELSASDEIRIRFFADNSQTPFLGCYRDDFDSNEIEFLEDDLRNTGITNVGFVESLRVDFFEADDALTLGDDGPYTIDIATLAPGDPLEKYYTQEVLIANSGIYRLEYKLSRLPETHKKI